VAQEAKVALEPDVPSLIVVEAGALRVKPDPLTFVLMKINCCPAVVADGRVIVDVSATKYKTAVPETTAPFVSGLLLFPVVPLAPVGRIVLAVPAAPGVPVAPVAPLGIVKLKVAAEEVPALLTAALEPAAPVVVVPT
jgi:hypothetical protein